MPLSIAQAETAEEIVDKARDANQVQSSVQSVRMTLVSKSGSERVRELDMRARRDEEIVKSLVRFTKPSDVAGTQLLLIDHPGQVDEQLLYLPAVKRTNRISGKSRKGSFMGSDFSYEDFETTDMPDAAHSMVSSDGDVWVIDSKPGSDSSYGRVRSYITKSDYVSRKVEFFDQEDAQIKVLEVVETKVEGSVTLPMKSVMKTLKKGTETRLDILEVQLDVSTEVLPDETFTQEFMERG